MKTSGGSKNDSKSKDNISEGVAGKIKILRRAIQNSMGGNVWTYVAGNETMCGLYKYTAKLFAK